MQTFENMLTQLNQTDHQLLKSQMRDIKLDQFRRLLQKLIKNASLSEKIRQNDQETMELLSKSFGLLILCMEQDLANNIVKKDYILSLRALTKMLTQKYKLVPKGQIIGQYLALGLVFSAGIGIVFFTSQPTYYAIVISSGIILGITIGNSMENKTAKEGLLY